MKILKRCTLLCFTLLVVTSGALAQEFTLGSDVVSRYVWRGYDFGESLSIQPTLEMTAGAVTIGTWGSYAVSSPGAAANEHDLYASVALGPASVGVTDYYFPGPGADGFFDFDDGGDGAHVVEPFASVTVADGLNLYGAINAYNDPDHSTYLEASYPFAVDGVELGLTAGVVPGASSYYGTDGFSVVNLSLSASRAIPITDRFELPVHLTYTLNPDTERTFLVFGISL